MTRRHITAAFLLGALSLASGCKDFLDVNTNPNAPESVSANLYLPPMDHWMVTAPQYDGRFIGRYTQQWANTNGVPRSAPGTAWATTRPATTAPSSGVTCTGRSARTSST